jgi:hypothetical protein
LFAPRRFVRDVPSDPELYFAGEEITLTVRAFTHGYDLFEPSRVIVWHEYPRAYRRKHWDDHLGDGGPAWYERDGASRERIRRLFDEPSFGRFGLGTDRTLEEYEAYAGISFRHRKVQDPMMRQARSVHRGHEIESVARRRRCAAQRGTLARAMYTPRRAVESVAHRQKALSVQRIGP